MKNYEALYPVYDDEIIDEPKKSIPDQLFELLNKTPNSEKFRLWNAYNNNGTWTVYLYSKAVYPELPRELFSAVATSTNESFDKVYSQIIQKINQINHGTC